MWDKADIASHKADRVVQERRTVINYRMWGKNEIFGGNEDSNLASSML